MAKRNITRASPEKTIGERMRSQRVEVLGKSIRDVAKLLGTAPIHISDIETGKRSPSEELLVKIAGAYGIPESELRAGFAKPEAVVARVASESAVAAEKVPEFLRRASGMTAEQWDRLISHVKKVNPRAGD